MTKKVIKCPCCGNPAARTESGVYQCLGPYCRNEFGYKTAYVYGDSGSTKSANRSHPGTGTSGYDPIGVRPGAKASKTAARARTGYARSVGRDAFFAIGAIFVLLGKAIACLLILLAGLVKLLPFLFFLSPIIALALAIIGTIINIQNQGPLDPGMVKLVVGGFVYFCISTCILFGR